MKKLATILLISFAAIALFSYTGIYHHSNFSECLKTVFGQNSMPCETSSSVTMAISHADIYHWFSTTTTLSLVLLLMSLAILAMSFKLLPEIKISQTVYATKLDYSHSLTKHYNWLTITEKRDPSSN